MRKKLLNALRSLLAVGLLAATGHGLYGHFERVEVDRAAHTTQGYIPCRGPGLSDCDILAMTTAPDTPSYAQIWLYTGLCVAAIITAGWFVTFVAREHRHRG